MQVDGISVAAAEAIQAASVVSGYVAPATGHLILVTEGGTEIDAGSVVPLTDIDLSDIAFTGTLAEFNAALSDADFATTSGSGGIGSEQVVYKSADESVVSNTVLQNDDHLFFTVVAGEKYVIEGALSTDDNAGSWDIKVALNGPAVSNLKFSLNSGYANNTIYVYGGTIVLPQGTSGVVSGFIQCSANGTVNLQWAQDSIGGATPSKLLSGSFLRVRRVA